MTEDQFDALVDDATHAVNNLIPDRYLDRMGSNARSGLLVSINDALTAFLRDAIESAGPNIDNPTRACTVAAAICELFETHIAKCDEAGECEADRPPHIISETHRTTANIDSIASCDVESGTQIYLVLDDGAGFRITVEAVEVDEPAG
ncbi:hypothetical protein SAMN06295912_11279 [Sphingomonas laterariae]|uniref:Uncharacterized protein n=1 Tax=Edaphosphingomonas laterariae TaxID=861865 RepID=A0A239GJI1_9SPHN|nr:hypothetical protein [Sphingomonas laterariae]SNS68653.1 hypothetical protein SAMN06295912_11279 [Sphingomonas laterariae]